MRATKNTTMERRAFLNTLGCAWLSSKMFASGSSARSEPLSGDHRFKGPYGLELYSMRDELVKSVPATLAMVSKIGYTEVEAV
jgi:hypothetical protein